MTTSRTRARILTLAAVAAALLLYPVTVAAHAEIDVPTPADGATVEGTPPEVSGTFTQNVKPDGSSLVLRDASNDVVAQGGRDPGDARRMVITDLPELAPGIYEVRWTTNSAEDDEVARGTWSFTVTASTGTPAPTDSASPSAEPSAAPTASATPEPSAAPTASATPAPTDPTGTAGGDAILPIIAALATVLIGAGVLLSRRSRPSSGA